MRNIITIYFLLCFLVAISNTFFLQSRDLRRMLRLFPKAFEIETPVKNHPAKHKPNNYYRGDYYDNYDRYDSGEPSKKNLKKNSGRYVYIYDKKPHCNHPDHHHEKYPEDYLEKHQHHKKHKYEDDEDRIDYDKIKQKKLYNDKENDEVKVDKYSNFDYKNKDYVTGVLVTVPKIKNEPELENYYKENRENIFLQHLLKTEDNNHHRHHQIQDDEDKTYLY